MAENRGVLVATDTQTLNIYFGTEEVQMGPWQNKSRIFIGIKNNFVKHGKILAPKGAIFFGENEKIKTKKEPLWDYKGPFISGQYGFLTSAVFENKGEINTGTCPPIIRNINKVIHYSLPNEAASSSKVSLVNQMLLQADLAEIRGGFQLDNLPPFLLKGNLRAGDLIIETALFSPEKISRFSPIPEQLGKIELKGDVFLIQKDNSMLWLFAGNILNQTPITGESIYSFLCVGHKNVLVFKNESILRMRYGVLQGLKNRGTVYFEGDLGTSQTIEKLKNYITHYGYAV